MIQKVLENNVTCADAGSVVLINVECNVKEDVVPGA